MPSIVIGRPVRGDDYFDRESEQRRIWRLLDERNNILLLAPRRVGKTSLLLRVEHSAWGEGWLAAYASVADARDEADLLDRLVRAIVAQKEAKPVLERLRSGPLKRCFDQVRGGVSEISAGGLALKFRELPGVDWRGIADELKRALPCAKRRWVLMLDEVPVFVSRLLRQEHGRERARDFLQAFRDLRQGGPGQAEDPIYWIVAGSIGLDSLARRHGMVDTINDLAPFELGAFTAESADEFLRALAASAELELKSEVRSHLCRRAEWLVPHHLQILFAGLRDQCDECGLPPSPALVDAAFETALGHAYRTYFDHWSVRLTEELGSPDDAYARLILCAAAADPSGVTSAALSQALAAAQPDAGARGDTLAWLLDVLLRDGYLIEDAGRWRFRSPLLRGYWLRRFQP